MPITIIASKKLPTELKSTAEEADTAMGEGIAALIPAPEKPYNPKVVTALAQATANVAKLLGLDVKAESYSGPVAELDPDLARFLAMLEKAAADYGQPFPTTLDSIKGDGDLTAITAHLIGLAKDRDFKAFLAEPAPGESVGSEMGEEMGGSEEEEKKPFNFAARMK